MDSAEQESHTPSLLMDREWERIQSKTFTHWVNSHLRKRSQQVKDVTQDMRDGKMLHILLEIISGESLPKPETGKMRVHQVMNVSKCLNFVISKGVKLVGIGAEEIVDGNTKMTLGMIWTIILRFALPTDSSMSARDGLLLWCQKKTEPYSNVKVQNFSKSWSDGLAFCAIIHRHRPNLIDYDSLRKDQPKENLELAFSVAEKHLDIPVMLDIEDMLNMPPDEKSVMTYVSCYYQCFSTSHEMETAANLLGKALDSHLENLNKVKDFEALSSQINEWLDQTIVEMQGRDVDTESMDCLKTQKQDLSNYKSQVKPKWSDEKTRLFNAFNSLQTLLRINNRPEYVAPEHLNLKTIDSKWKQLIDEETQRLAWINACIKKLENIDLLVKKYNNKCSIMDSWAKDKLELLSKDIESVELNDLLIVKRRNQTFIGEVSNQKSRLKTIQSLLHQLKDLKCSKIDELEAHHDAIISTFSSIETASSEFTARLEEKVKQAQQLEELRVKYATDAIAITTSFNEHIEDLGDGYLALSVQDVKSLIESHESLKTTIAGYKTKIEEASQLEQQIMAISASPNPYTSYTSETISSLMSQLDSCSAEHEASLKEDLRKNEEREALANDILAKVAEVDTYQQQTKENIVINEGTLEEKLAGTKSSIDVINQYYEPKLAELAQMIESLDVFPSFLDADILSTVQNNYRSLLDIVLAEVNLLENQILIRDSSSITEKQMDEYKKAFSHFDKDSNGFLNADQFRNFLVGLGYNCTPNDPKCEREFENILSKVDPNKTDQVTLSSFLNYLATTTKGENNIEEMIQSFKVLAGGEPFITATILQREFGPKGDAYASQMKPYTEGSAPADALDYVSYAESIYGSSDL